MIHVIMFSGSFNVRKYYLVIKDPVGSLPGKE